MHPIIFQFGPFTLHAFGLMMALGFLAGLHVMRRLARGGFGSLTDDHLTRLIVWLMVGGVLGARLAYVAEHWTSEFAANPGAIIRIDQGGLMYYGGLLGAIATIFLFARVYRRHPLEVLDLCAAALPLGHAFGRIGCFLNGCCYGMRCKGPWGVRFPAGSMPWHEQVAQGVIKATSPCSEPVVPTQLIEAAANLVLVAVLYAIARRHPRRGQLTALYLMLYAVIRFHTEMLRGDARMQVGALSISQFISLLLMAAGLALWLALRFLPRRDGPAA
ncbi:MAG: prolipoprotein diacylglyceryl transferase [Lentisphaerae bacterium]|jgi:phosphatidylglycerol:prolipoprotein diacylglycerol transferase|nr:prolipoprotein diacylglyceryl transferase [Lentisphaerota bacterium]